MIVKTLLLVFLSSAMAQSYAQVNSLPSQPHLLVKGQAERSIAPDRFTVSLSLQRVDLSPERARTLAQADAEKILLAFKENKALKDTVEESTLSIQPQYSYEQNRQVFKGTQVSRTLSATFPDLAQVRTLLAAIHTSESLLVTGVSAEYSGEAKLRAELKREAAEQSRDSAEGLAKAYGARITGLYTISDVAPSFAYGVQAGSWPHQSDQPLPPAPQAPGIDIAEPRPSDLYRVAESLEAGALNISENVYAVFLIAQ
ncbi:MAG: SIMPL domain-containing protein [Pseudoxanthomonas sp.]